MRNRGWTAAGSAAGLGGLVLLLAACGSSGTNMNAGAAYGSSGMGATPSSSSMSGAGTTSGMGTKTVSLTIKTTKIGKVLTDAQGDTLYFYSKDTKDGPSTCTGACAAAWPLVLGKAVAAPGVKFAGVLGSVTDAGGAIQATYNGYPLYTYKADMAPGQTAGNGEGGVWHVISGSTLTAASSSGGMSSPSATKSSSGMGSGYGSGYGTGTKVSSGSSKSSGSATHTTPAAPPSTAPAAAPSTPAAPAPAPSPTLNGGGCGEGACW
jgi:predicted lipoprotein with Yx(FWY)xxD motif